MEKNKRNKKRHNNWNKQKNNTNQPVHEQNRSQLPKFHYVAHENIEKERKEVYAKKDKLIATMNQKILAFYEKIRKWAHNTAVVPVKKQACYGCFMQINDKTFSAVIKGEDIVTCPHCGRILYKQEQ